MKRLEYDADTRKDVINYFQTRARQLLPDGFVWQKDITEAPGGLITTFIKGNEVFKSYYCYASSRGKGHSSSVICSINERIVTSPDCHIEEFLITKKKSYVLGALFTETLEYKAVQDFYGDQKAERSQCYLMNHIDEGIYILHRIGATESAMKAFCLHPLIQSANDLAKNWEYVKDNFSAEVIGLTMEYRNIANAYLSNRTISNISEIELSPLKEVNDMLIADKIQNYADFIIYHSKTHPKKERLDEYFNNWLKRLHISIEKYHEIVSEFKRIEN